MQKLVFESSWEKTVSTKDRHQIEQVFRDTISSEKNHIHLSPLWQARNHKGQLLVTVLVHNTTQQPLSFLNTNIRYLENNERIAEHLFILPSLIIESETSMPWTFIFPADSLRGNATLENGNLEIMVLE